MRLVLDSDQMARRIKAARALAGISSTDALARRMGVQGLSGETLRKIESGNRNVRPHELREIARACELPYAFFQVDFDVLEAFGGEPDLEDRIVDRVTERVLERLRNDGPPEQRTRRAG